MFSPALTEWLAHVCTLPKHFLNKKEISMTEDSTFCDLPAVPFAATQFSVLVSSGQNLRHLWSLRNILTEIVRIQASITYNERVVEFEQKAIYISSAFCMSNSPPRSSYFKYISPPPNVLGIAFNDLWPT